MRVKGATVSKIKEGEKVKINVISNDKYFLCLDLCIDYTRREAYFVIEKGERGVSGSYKKFYYTTGKAAFRKFDELEKILFDKYGVK